MSEKSYRSPSGGWNVTSLMRDITTAWRLLLDPQVSGVLKLLLPIAALIYFISPFDLLPGPIDDAVVLFVALRLFLQMAPTEALHNAQGSANPTNSSKPDDNNTIDTTWRVVDDK